MPRFRSGLLASCALACVCSAQLTPQQKQFDFQHLASIYAKYYAPYEWKRDLLGFDLYAIQSWLGRVRSTSDDLEYLEVASEYVAGLRDTHSGFELPSNFSARIGIFTDIYDGKVLIDGITRSQLPASRFPFQIGDEVVSVDGKSAAEIVRDFSRFTTMANPRGTARLAASYIFFRPQASIPRAHQVGEEANIVIRRASGDLETYSIPWIKRGVPLTRLNGGPGPFLDGGPAKTRTGNRRSAASAPSYRSFLESMQNKSMPGRGRVNGWGVRAPFFALPDGFTQRLGLISTDFHYSGTYSSGGKRIGYLRIPNFSPPSQSAALRELRAEIAFMRDNTDGLVIDVTRNTGGGCYGELALQSVIPYRFHVVTDEVRVSLDILNEAELQLDDAEFFGAEEWEITLLRLYFDQLKQAYAENRGRTGPIPLCSPSADLTPATNDAGQVIAYSKPAILLTDEFTVSWGDAFSAIFADAARGPLVGYRTDGAGGVIFGVDAGFYSESFTTFTATLGTRTDAVSAPGYPKTAYIENVGVHPDVVVDAMTRDNLMSRFKPFVDAFTAVILAEIGKQ
jgi:hypothetical protein